MAVATRPKKIFRYPIQIVKDQDSWGAYAIGIPVTAIDKTKARVKRRIAEVLRFHLACCIEEGHPLPNPRKNKRATDYVEIGLR